jgi:hypothetical protein
VDDRSDSPSEEDSGTLVQNIGIRRIDSDAGIYERLVALHWFPKAPFSTDRHLPTIGLWKRKLWIFDVDGISRKYAPHRTNAKLALVILQERGSTQSPGPY